MTLLKLMVIIIQLNVLFSAAEPCSYYLLLFILYQAY